ncbi:hypothetical protein QQZ08_002183 [Neonectria magnoliae]|uniref:Uncharacterized protein n=1 Tax=Neonectria magnoliae TaxID=2732573 RepID=A0ABR1IC06_9HYPO
MSTLEDDRSLPLFASLNPAPSPFFYFHHIVNGEDTTLTIQVIGPNLEFKFAHSRAKAYLTPTQIAHRLANKTVGFLALVTPTGERTVLAAAESGHGGGKLGDMLDAAPGVLANMLWTKRVVAVGRLLGLSMESPFDSGGGPRVRGRQGLFRGSHAEVKLAVHGIAVLLDVFGITKDFDAVTARHLRGLRDKRWEDGTRPRFEVFFSRKHCGSCGKLVRALEEATGVSIQLLWKPRLELKQYAKANPTAASRRRQRVPRLVDEQDRDLGDQLSKEESDDETVGGEESGDEREEEGDVQVIDMVDLISHPSFTISPTPHPADDVQVIDTIDLVSRPSFSVELTPHPADDYINGLAYRVGQIQSSPDGAAEAIVQFAQQMTGNRQAAARDARDRAARVDDAAQHLDRQQGVSSSGPESESTVAV